MLHEETSRVRLHQEGAQQTVNEEGTVAIFDRERTELLGILTDVPIDVTDDEISNALAWLPDYVPYPYSHKAWYGEEQFIRLNQLDDTRKSIVLSYLESRKFPFIRTYDEIVKYVNLYKLQHEHTRIVYQVTPNYEYVVLAVLLSDGKPIEIQKVSEILKEHNPKILYHIKGNLVSIKELRRMPRHIINEVILGLHEDKTIHL